MATKTAGRGTNHIFRLPATAGRCAGDRHHRRGDRNGTAGPGVQNAPVHGPEAAVGG